MYLLDIWKVLITLEKLEMKNVDYQIVKTRHHSFRKPVFSCGKDLILLFSPRLNLWIYRTLTKQEFLKTCFYPKQSNLSARWKALGFLILFCKRSRPPTYRSLKWCFYFCALLINLKLIIPSEESAYLTLWCMWCWGLNSVFTFARQALYRWTIFSSPASTRQGLIM